jgi:hypothetical protein
MLYDGLFSMNARLQDGVTPCFFNDKGFQIGWISHLNSRLIEHYKVGKVRQPSFG